MSSNTSSTRSILPRRFNNPILERPERNCWAVSTPYFFPLQALWLDSRIDLGLRSHVYGADGRYAITSCCQQHLAGIWITDVVVLLQAPIPDAVPFQYTLWRCWRAAWEIFHLQANAMGSICPCPNIVYVYPRDHYFANHAAMERECLGAHLCQPFHRLAPCADHQRMDGF